MLCRVDGCGRETRYTEAQLCQKHYFRQRRNGTTDLVRPRAKPRQENPQGYQWIYQPGHPLSFKSGYVAEHRAVLYADLGDGPLACELCGKGLTWKTCHVDHIDNDVRNNARSNLRPTCSTCNTHRGIGPAIHWQRTHVLEHNGVALTPEEWSRQPGVNVWGATIIRRLNAGMSVEQALFAPKKTHNGKAKKPKGPPKPHMHITFEGQTLTPREWARQPGVTVTDVTIRKRIRDGVPVAEALFAPAADTGVSGREFRAKVKALKAEGERE